MKKLLLFVAALFVAAGAMAQDIYLGTYNASTNGYEYKIYKNGIQEAYHTPTTSSSNFMLENMMAADGDLYYLNHWYKTNGTDMEHWTDVRKAGASSAIFNCPTGQGIILTGLAYENGDVYASGSFHSTDGRDYGYVTKNGAVLYQHSENGYDCKMMGITVCNGDVFTCGGEAANEGSSGENYSYVTVWKNGVAIGDAYIAGQYSYGYDIALYNGMLYICGKVKKDGVWKGALWKISATASYTSNNMTLVGTVSNSESVCSGLYQDAGNIYVSYMIYGSSSGVYKYNAKKGTFTNTNYTYAAPASSMGSIVANNHGVYTSANGAGKYWLNGQAVTVSYTTDAVRKIAVACKSSGTVYELPFEDRFGNGTTHWDDWYTYDYNTQDGYYPSYWGRIDYSGSNDYAAWHKYNCDNGIQKADLVSPKIRIPADYNATLRFYTKVWDLDDYENNGAALYITQNYQPNYGTLLWKLDDAIASGDIEEDTWTQFTVDLSAYKGKTIQLIFYYKGECAHSWLVDDVIVTGTYDGIEEEETEAVALSVMPNPANDVIRVNGLNGMEEVYVYNTLGQVVKSARLNNGESISISDLSSGVYMLRSEKNAQVVKFTVK